MTEQNQFTKIQHTMEQKGFFPVTLSADMPFSCAYIRIENPVQYLILLHDGTTADTTELRTQSQSMTETLAQKQDTFRCTRTVCLTILTGENNSQLKDFATSQQISFEGNIQYIWWYYSFAENQLFTGKNQPKKLLGIEKILAQANKNDFASNLSLSIESTNKKSLPIVTISIFLLCLFLLVAMLLTGHKTDWIFRFGLSREGILRGEFYRLLTAMFLHSGIQHLAANSIYLIYFGIPMERILGTKKYLFLYLIAGLSGGLFSLIFSGHLAVGASGAIFGLLGASLLLTHEKGVAFTGMNYATMLLLSIAALGMGMLDSHVDNFAHIGGFLCGLLILHIFLRKKSG